MTNSKQTPTGARLCPVYKKCGGCQLQNLTYGEQLRYKQAKVIRLLGRFHHVDEIVGMDNPWHYRNKVQAAFGKNRRGETISGVYRSGTHSITPVDSCMIEDKKADEIIVTVRRFMKSFKIEPYDERTRRGCMRHVLVKRGFSTNEIMVVLVTATPVFPSRSRFTEALLEKHPDITTIVHNINPHRTSLVLGETEHVLFGNGKIKDTLCGCTFRISAKSFYQINPVQTEKLYNKAIELAGLTGQETVIDAYCGTGTIGIIASRQAKKVIGVELNGDAVHDAKENARDNKIENIRFFCDDAGKFMVGMAKAHACADVVLMDPPRAGSDYPFLRSLVTLNPKRVVYISCNPETQARDLLYLCKNGYRVRKICPFDMFPHTNHVECIAMLERSK